MAVEGIQSQISRESHGKGIAEGANWIEAIRHGNIYEVLKTHNVSRADVENFLASEHKQFKNSIIQDYEVYAGEGMIDPPDLQNHFAVQQSGMAFDSNDRQLMRRDMKAMMTYRAQEADKPAVEGAGEAGGTGGAGAEKAPPDVATIAEGALHDWNEFYQELQTKMVDAQMFSQLKTKTAELQKEVQRVIDLVKQGIVEPEFVLVAAAKVNMLQNGTFFSWKGRRIFNLNQQMDKVSRDLYKMNPNDQGYVKEAQMAGSVTRGMSSQMQLEVMDLQKYSQNVATTLEWVSGAIRMFREMRQQPTQAIAAR